MLLSTHHNSIALPMFSSLVALTPEHMHLATQQRVLPMHLYASHCVMFTSPCIFPRRSFLLPVSDGSAGVSGVPGDITTCCISSGGSNGPCARLEDDPPPYSSYRTCSSTSLAASACRIAPSTSLCCRDISLPRLIERSLPLAMSAYDGVDAVCTLPRKLPILDLLCTLGMCGLPDLEGPRLGPPLLGMVDRIASWFISKQLTPGSGLSDPGLACLFSARRAKVGGGGPGWNGPGPCIDVWKVGNSI